MLIQTILNRCYRIKGFIYGKANWSISDGEDIIEISVRPREEVGVKCSVCGRSAPIYDTAKEPRRFEFVPLWGYAVILLYKTRRVSCPEHGVKVEQIPWADGKQQLGRVYQQFLAN